MGAADSNFDPPGDDAFVADALAPRGVPERVNYATGVLLDASDFADEQAYLRGRHARALAATHGHGTLAGLRVGCPLTLRDAAGAATANSTLEVRVAPGLALDRLGRLIEVRATQCLAITRWLANLAAQPASDLDRVRLIDALREAAAPEAGLVLVLDVFLRFVVCPHGRTPAFASGAFNATDFVVPSRLADAFELTLQLAHAVRAQPANPADPDTQASTLLAQPAPRSDALQAMQDALAGIADAAQRAAADRAFQLASVLDAWPAPDPIDPSRLRKLREHTDDADWDRVLLGRVTVPVVQTAAGAFPTLDAARLADPGADRDLADNTLRPIVFNPAAWRGAV